MIVDMVECNTDRFLHSGDLQVIMNLIECYNNMFLHSEDLQMIIDIIECVIITCSYTVEFSK